MPILTITWGTSLDPCPFCSTLNGFQWTYLSGARRTPNILNALGKQVWNLRANHSTAHGTERYNCRCELTGEVDMGDISRFARNLRIGLR